MTAGFPVCRSIEEIIEACADMLDKAQEMELEDARTLASGVALSLRVAADLERKKKAVDG